MHCTLRNARFTTRPTAYRQKEALEPLLCECLILRRSFAMTFRSRIRIGSPTC